MRLPPWLWLTLGTVLLASPAAPKDGPSPGPATPQVATPEPPRVDLRRLHIDDSGARAPLESQKQAELTIDLELQRTAEQLLREAHPLWGGAVLVDVRTGKIRVWGQYRHDGQAHYDELATRLVPSASVFKLITSAALLEDTPVTIKSKVCVMGGEHGIERRHLARSTDPKRQCLPFFRALGFSVNAAYAQLVTEHLPRDALLSMVERFGFNAPLPFDGAARLGDVTIPFGDLEYARTATGFEHTRLTVLGAAQLAHAIALEGRMPRLHLIERAGDYRAPERVEIQRRVIRTTTARRLARMMEVTVHSGTALESFTDATTHQSYLSDLRIAGKTGTLLQKQSHSTVSWFTGFAPARDPQVVIAVALENRPVWRRRAADVARDLLRARFSERRGITHPLPHKTQSATTRAAAQ